MKIKSVCVGLILFSVTSLSYGQKKTAYEKDLLSKYTTVQLDEMSKSNPDEIKFLNTFVTNGYYVTDFPKGKEGASEISGAVTINNLNAINFFALNIAIKESDYQYFTIVGTDKLLVVKSRNAVVKEMKK